MTAFADLTTFRVGGSIADYREVSSEEALIDAVRSADEAGIPLLVLGGGSNLLASDAPFDGRVVRDIRTDIVVCSDEEAAPHAADAGGACDSSTVEDSSPALPVEATSDRVETTQGSNASRVRVRISAGAVWDDVVRWSVERGLSGLEALSGIPGTVGAAPVQNIGAYGHEVAEFIVEVTAWDRARAQKVRLSAEALGFAYRSSVIKRSLADAAGVWAGSATGRWVILDVTFDLEVSPWGAPVLYRELADRVGVELGGRTGSREIREAVCALRAGKGMLLDSGDHDTWSAGSFFTNPILPTDAPLPEGAPRFPAGVGAQGREMVKTSAAWLIDHAGFPKGYSVQGDVHEGTAPASLSTKHVLALTNRGTARAEDIVQLARTVRVGVCERYGIVLEPEPVALGIAW